MSIVTAIDLAADLHHIADVTRRLSGSDVDVLPLLEQIARESKWTHQPSPLDAMVPQQPLAFYVYSLRSGLTVQFMLVSGELINTMVHFPPDGIRMRLTDKEAVLLLKKDEGVEMCTESEVTATWDLRNPDTPATDELLEKDRLMHEAFMYYKYYKV